MSTERGPLLSAVRPLLKMCVLYICHGIVLPASEGWRHMKGSEESREVARGHRSCQVNTLTQWEWRGDIY